MFQKTVLHKYLKTQNADTLSQRWEVYKHHFHNPKIQDNIRNAKEEQYQEGFLRDLFVNILGYTLNPAEGFNLTTELKNIKDSKKADGAILIDEKVKAVIELKGTNITDLSKIEAQAFGYKVNQPGCVYVITSNFHKLRFYVHDAVEFIEFDLFTLTENQFKTLYLCLAVENITQDIPLKIKQESVSKEENITQKLYKDYSQFKQSLFVNLCVLNPEVDAMVLFKKSQKLLDRFLFLFFAEDRGLLPANAVRKILSQWKQLKELDAYTPLYNRFLQYFGYLNTGNQDRGIFAYNGGLFKPDEILDTVKIDDEVLYTHTKKLSEYDFDSEVDVNILGHIFENSLNELDEMQTILSTLSVGVNSNSPHYMGNSPETEGKLQFAPTVSKRKRDGVFYTPKYITKYIVDNTVGKLCTQKKTELGVIDEEYIATATKKTKEQLLQKLKDYRAWLLEITIIDPACGSGAFLNEALNFLIAEHHYIDELERNLFGGGFEFHEVENHILENNLFGVDLNEESVEIAKLSLWLRTAQPNRKLNDLSKNIQCGNSLIADPAIAGDKAFDWQKAFPQVFEKGGFDVVIGNPPYVNMTQNNTDRKWLEYYIVEYQSVKSANSKNLYTLFNEKSVHLVKENGLISFIIPEGFLRTRSYDDCVKFMNENGFIYKAIYFEDWVFADATTGSMIFEFKKDKNYVINFEEFLFTKEREIKPLIKEENPIIEKYNRCDFPLLSDVADSFKGMAVKDRKNFIFSEKTLESPDLFLLGNCIDRYSIKNNFFTNYDNLVITGGTKKKEKYEVFPRIMVRRTGDYLCCTLLNEIAFTESTLYSVSIVDKSINVSYLLALMNSELLSYVVKQSMITNQQAFPQILMTDLQLLKIPKISEEDQQPFIALADQMLSLNKDLHELKGRFIRMLLRKFEIEKLSTKLLNWHELSFAAFVKELAKAKIKLSLSEEAEWEEYFLTEQQKAQAITTQITATDKEINERVYALYNVQLTIDN
ncbi:Eco57I restriction-modification methylase domain-containing protein [Capnocytophaga sp. ARDL2]|uniref:Eco57I restriction-modification methylase domain-containing protein n=1 Tax=Capnocytophaga sp. ARDL2 TaxID=3238809 RepID=UPI0035581AFF